MRRNVIPARARSERQPESLIYKSTGTKQEIPASAGMTLGIHGGIALVPPMKQAPRGLGLHHTILTICIMHPYLTNTSSFLVFRTHGLRSFMSWTTSKLKPCIWFNRHRFGTFGRIIKSSNFIQMFLLFAMISSCLGLLNQVIQVFISQTRNCSLNIFKNRQTIYMRLFHNNTLSFSTI